MLCKFYKIKTLSNYATDKSESQSNKNGGKICTAATGARFEHGSIWKVGDCQSCKSESGLITCFSQTCPILHCDITVQQKGNCCPKCTGKSNSVHLYML